jgi:hypothetical protein
VHPLRRPRPSPAPRPPVPARPRGLLSPRSPPHRPFHRQSPHRHRHPGFRPGGTGRVGHGFGGRILRHAEGRDDDRLAARHFRAIGRHGQKAHDPRFRRGLKRQDGGEIARAAALRLGDALAVEDQRHGRPCRGLSRDHGRAVGGHADLVEKRRGEVRRSLGFGFGRGLGRAFRHGLVRLRGLLSRVGPGRGLRFGLHLRSGPRFGRVACRFRRTQSRRSRQRQRPWQARRSRVRSSLCAHRPQTSWMTSRVLAPEPGCAPPPHRPLVWVEPTRRRHYQGGKRRQAQGTPWQALRSVSIAAPGPGRPRLHGRCHRAGDGAGAGGPCAWSTGRATWG